jgi:DNA-binding MarR family transcriptional regulator
MSAQAEAVAAEHTEGVRLALIELMGAERRLRARDQRCGPGQLTHAQIRALFTLDVKGEATAGELAKAAELSPASVSTMLDALERDAIVERRRSDHDRRVVVVTLTETGRGLVADKRTHWRTRMAASLDGVSPEQLAAAADVMHRIAATLDEL